MQLYLICYTLLLNIKQSLVFIQINKNIQYTLTLNLYVSRIFIVFKRYFCSALWKRVILFQRTNRMENIWWVIIGISLLTFSIEFWLSYSSSKSNSDQYVSQANQSHCYDKKSSNYIISNTLGFRGIIFKLFKIIITMLNKFIIFRKLNWMKYCKV